MTQLEFDEKVLFGSVFETDNILLFDFFLKKKWYTGYYDKKLAKAFTTKEVLIINDMDDTNRGKYINTNPDTKIYGFTYSDYQFNDIIIIRRNSAFDMDVLKKRVTESKFVEINTMLDSLLLEDDDPVILSLLHLKK